MEVRKRQPAVFTIHTDDSTNQKISVPVYEKKYDLRKRPALKDVGNAKKVTRYELRNGNKAAGVSLKVPNQIKEKENSKALEGVDSSSSKTKRNKSTSTEVDSGKKGENHEYSNDIYANLRSVETTHQPIRTQAICSVERNVLVVWLAEVSMGLRLQNETLYLAVAYVDRFLCRVSVNVKTSLELVGCGALLIAMKFQEVNVPSVRYLTVASGDTWTQEEIFDMEVSILKTLAFKVATPTCLDFLLIYCSNLPENVRHLAMYLSELALLERDCYWNFLPSYLAAAAVVLAQHTLREEVWPKNLRILSGYKLRYLKLGVSCLEKTFKSASKLPDQFVMKKKYSTREYGFVSLLLPRSTYVYDSEDDD